MKSAANKPFNPAQCPLCGQSNQCAMEIEKETGEPEAPCWCVGLDFSAELLARVPDDKKNKACICQRCASHAQPSSSAISVEPQNQSA